MYKVCNFYLVLKNTKLYFIHDYPRVFTGVDEYYPTAIPTVTFTSDMLILNTNILVATDLLKSCVKIKVTDSTQTSVSMNIGNTHKYWSDK